MYFFVLVSVWIHVIILFCIRWWHSAYNILHIHIEDDAHIGAVIESIEFLFVRGQFRGGKWLKPGKTQPRIPSLLSISYRRVCVEEADDEILRESYSVIADGIWF